MFTINLHLVLITIDIKTGARFVLSLLEDSIMLPGQMLDQSENIQDVVEKLCDQYLRLDPEWLNPQCKYVGQNETQLDLYYAALVPFGYTGPNYVKEDVFFQPVSLIMNANLIDIVRNT